MSYYGNAGGGGGAYQGYEESFGHPSGYQEGCFASGGGGGGVHYGQNHHYHLGYHQQTPHLDRSYSYYSNASSGGGDYDGSFTAEVEAPGAGYTASQHWQHYHHHQQQQHHLQQLQLSSEDLQHQGVDMG